MGKTTGNDTKILKVSKDSVTRDDLRSMAVAQRIDFSLPGKSQYESAVSACSQMKGEQRVFSTKFTGDKMADKWSILIERVE